MKKLCYLLTFLFVNLYNLTYTDNKLSFDFDYAYFKAEDSKLYLEIYYAFNQEELLFVKTNDGFEAGGKISLDLFSNSLKGNIVMKDYRIPLKINDTSGYNRHTKLTGQIIYIVDPGDYKVSIKACDLHDSANCNTVSDSINLKPVSSTAVSSSSIQLSTGIKKSNDEKSPFYKNTLEVIPNPSNLFGNNLSELYYYFELYNLKKELISENYFVSVSISDINGKEIRSLVKNYKIITDSKVEMGSIDIKDLPTDKYYLFVKILNDQNTELLDAYKLFYIFNSDVAVDNTNITDIEKEYISSEYPKMSLNQLDDEFDKAIYLMTDKNRKKYKDLTDLDSKRKFMFAFWDALDPNPLTPESEFKTEYFKKIEFSNKNFKSDFRDGWKTDRGRIYCLYGKYDEVERHSYEGPTKAYEIWTYNNIQGGVIFVFIDKSAGYGDYELEHSTARNEVYDENWRNKLLVK